MITHTKLLKFNRVKQYKLSLRNPSTPYTLNKVAAAGHGRIVNPGRFTMPGGRKPRNDPLRKYAILVGLVILALIIDGTMSYDIFDSRPETIKMWLVLGLIVIIGLVIVIADSSKTNNNQDNSE